MLKRNIEWRSGLTRYVYLCDYIFNITTYDDELSKLFARKALEVCVAITTSKTFEYILDAGNYKCFIIMLNLDFFQNKVDWGCSIRGAWWDIYGDKTFEIDSCGFWENDNQIIEPLKFNKDEWTSFIKAMQEFVKDEKSNAKNKTNFLKEILCR